MVCLWLMMRWSPASRSSTRWADGFTDHAGAAGDPLTLEGLDKLHYSIANRRIRSQNVPTHMPIHFWRSMAFRSTPFSQRALSMSARTVGGEDPLDYRRALLRDNPRHLAVLNKVAELSGWGSPLAAGAAAGSHIEECYRTVVAQVAEVTVDTNGRSRSIRYFVPLMPV